MPSSQKRSLGERRRRWYLLIGSRQDILEHMPHLQGDVDELAAVEKEVSSLVVKQAQVLAKHREITAKIRALAKKGDRLRGRIGSGLRWKHGFDGAALVQFGFKPRRTKPPSVHEKELAALPGGEASTEADEAPAALEGDGS